MARIVGVDLPKNKRGEIGLTYIYGIGRSTAHSAKIRQHMTILADFCARKVTNPRSEKFTFYWHGEKEITMFAALYIAGRYVQKLELGYRLSDDQTDQIMQEVMCGITTEDYNQILLKYL